MPEQIPESLLEIERKFSGKIGLCAQNLADRDDKIELGARARFPTASLIKVCILLELFRQCDRGKLSLDHKLTLHEQDKVGGSGILIDLLPGLDLTLHDTAVLMMALSDNTATNMLIDLLDLKSINRTIDEAGLRNTELRNKIDFALLAQSPENFGVGTPADFALLFTRLGRRELLSEDSTHYLLEIMRIQKYIEPFRRYLPVNPYADELGEEQTVSVASKTGGLPGVRCEAGLITTPQVTYALAVMCRDYKQSTFTSDDEGTLAIARVSRVVYDYFTNR